MIPEMHWESFVYAGKDQGKMILEYICGLFCGIATVQVQQYFFIHYSLFFDELKKVFGTLIV